MVTAPTVYDSSPRKRSPPLPGNRDFPPPPESAWFIKATKPFTSASQGIFPPPARAGSYTPSPHPFSPRKGRVPLSNKSPLTYRKDLAA